MAKKTYVEGSRTPSKSDRDRRSSQPVGKSDSSNEKSQDATTAKNINVGSEAVVKHLKELRDAQDNLKVFQPSYFDILEEGGKRRTPPVPKLPDYSPVSFKVRFQSTGLSFQIGKLVKPSNADVDHSLKILMEQEVLDEEFLPEGVYWSSLFGENSYVWRKEYIIKVLEVLGVYWDRGGGWRYPYTPDEVGSKETKVLAAIWVLLCWDHMVNYGRRPVPSMHGILQGNFMRRTPIKRLYCPFCNKNWKDVGPDTPDSLRMRAYRSWLREHSIEYHRWSGQTQKALHPKLKRSTK
jgi:hypothetical protein